MSKVTWDEKCLNPLLSAVRGTSIETVRFLVEEGYLPSSGLTRTYAFRNALSSGTVEIVKYLISKGCDVREEDRNERTALHYSVRNIDNPDVTRYLLEAFNLDAHATDRSGRTPLEELKHTYPRSSCIRRILLDHRATDESVNQDAGRANGISRKRSRDQEPEKSRNTKRRCQ